MNLRYPENGRTLRPGGGERYMGPSDRELSIIEDVLLHIRRKRRLSDEEWEEFRGWAWLKLAESEYAALRKFESRGSLQAYLAVVLTRLLLDYRTQKWGRWRPSAKAKALGPEAIELENLIQIKGYSARNAVRSLVIDHQCPLGEGELEQFVAQLPVRRKNWMVAEDWIDELPSPRPSPHDELEARDVAETHARVESCLDRALARLEQEECLALKMRFEQGLKLNEIARALGREPKSFYRRFQRTLDRLRRFLGDDGIDARFLEITFSEDAIGANSLIRSVLEP